MISLALLFLFQAEAPAAEQPVAPYAQSNANAGATPFKGTAMWAAFHESAGVARIVDDLIDHSLVDPRISEVFKGQDIVRLRRTLKEQFCYILNGGCDYSGRTMQAAHANMGVQTADMGALVENLQAAMRREKIGFDSQNRFLAKLAPMRRDVVKQVAPVAPVPEQ
jgi:hemoglobin